MWRAHLGANIGFAIPPDVVILDADGPNALKQLLDLAAPHGGLPTTLTAKTKRGWHFYYRAPQGVRLKCWAMKRAHKGDDGIDIKTAGGYVLLPPSGGRYAWANAAPMAELPGWLVEWVMAQSGAPRATKPLGDPNRPAWLPLLGQGRRISEGAGVEELPPIEDVVAALAVIPNPDRGWDDWNRILMAVWASTAGSADGLELAIWWGSESKKFDENDTIARWNHFATSPPTSIGYGTLVHEARGARPGWEAPSREACEPDTESSGHSSEDAAETEVPDPPEGGQGEQKQGVNGFHFAGEQTAPPKSNNPLIKLNEKYAVIGDIGGKCLVLSFVPGKADRNLKVPSFQSFKSFTERFGNRYVNVGKGEEKESKPLGAYWLKWPGREGYEGIDLVPNGPRVLENGALNLWGGFGVTAAAGDWSLMRQHICEVLAAGDPEAAQYIIRFAAWAVQHPGERAEVALVFRGGKGSGKGTFANALVRIFGQHGLQVFNSKHLVGAFNGHLRNCLLLFADEAFWAGDRQGESTLKGMLTERVLVIEQKGIDAVLWENRLHVIMAANADWVVPASHDERRFAMFNVSDKRIGDRTYFKALHEELMPANGGAGGLGAMLHDLSRVDLGEWHPRDVLATTALREQKEMSLNPIAAWWEEFLQRGVMPALSADKPYRMAAGWLLAHAREHASRPGDINPSALGRFLRIQGGLRLHTERGTVWEMPKLPECRHIWEKRYGGWKWENSSEDWKK
jgi:hypothetical protein